MGSCVLCLLETVSRQCLSLIGPALYPGAVARGWLRSVPQLWLRIQIRHAAVTRAALPLCRLFRWTQEGLGHKYKTTPMSWNAREKPKQDKSRQKPTEGTWRGRLFCRSMKEGIRSGRKQDAFYG